MNKSLVLGTLTGLALLTVPALAIPITGILSLQGSDLYSNTLSTITFVPGTSSVGGVSTGTLAPFTALNPATMYNFSFDGPFVPGSPVFTTTENGVTAALVLYSLNSHVDVSNGLVINASGVLSETGFDSTAANFVLTTQDGGKDVNVVTFSATVIPVSASTPEPSTIALLGTGLIGLAGVVRKRLTS